jgi:hypothetical protein
MISYTSRELLEQVIGRLITGEPIAVVRYGDGEAMVLNGFNDMSALKMVMKRQLGFIPPVDQIEQIRENLIAAYKAADVIGIPVRRRLEDKSSYWYRAFSLLVDALGPEYINEKKFGNIDFHSEWLEAGYFDELLSRPNVLCYVSCRNLDAAFRHRYGKRQVYSFTIAPEMKFTGGYKGEPHYPDQFNKVRKWMDKIPIQGNICMVGAGAVGKIYTTWFKERGGIAIDVGYVFDAWAGRSTRGPDRGLDKIDTTYKL